MISPHDAYSTVAIDNCNGRQTITRFFFCMQASVYNLNARLIIIKHITSTSTSDAADHAGFTLNNKFRMFRAARRAARRAAPLAIGASVAIAVPEWLQQHTSHADSKNKAYEIKSIK